jgi:hypothetical protein
LGQRSYLFHSEKIPGSSGASPRGFGSENSKRNDVVQQLEICLQLRFVEVPLQMQ